MRSIEISEETYSKLQRLGVAFVDTPETVIARIADAALARQARVAEPSPEPTGDRIVLDPVFTGNLAHTRVRRASFDGVEVEPAQWNQLLRVAHTEARRRLGSFEGVKEVTSARIREGEFNRDGFKYVPDADLSVQGLDSNLAWVSSLRLAKALQVPIEVEFEWHQKESAAHPGKRGSIRWDPDAEVT